MPEKNIGLPATPAEGDAESSIKPGEPRPRAKEVGGPAGPEPTRYGDWEVKGRCSDF